jgi:peptide chain release factor 2
VAEHYFRKVETRVRFSPSALNMQKEEIQKKIAEIEIRMAEADFWSDKDRAQATIKEYQDLKDDLAGVGKYDKGNAILTIFSGAGGTDAEDFARMLLSMYLKFCESNNFATHELHKNENDFGGIRNVTLEILGKNAYGTLKNESGVHRLVRISPYNAKEQRHTSFAMVEFVPELPDVSEVDIKEDEIRVDFARSSGPGGQNVNKRETAVRIVHVPTNISVHVDSERSQLANKKKAMEILSGKLYHKLEEERKIREKGMQISSTTDAEWGSQIRSYVLHPYKLVKDHRTDIEVRDVEKVLDGDISEFLAAEKDL